ncbi:ATP-dependent DNA ligase, partial [Corallococcus praedator]
KPAQVRAAAAETPVYFYAFDLLRLDGISLLRKKYRDRRTLLEALGIDGDVCSTPDRLDGTLQEALAESKRLGLEGVVAKRTDSVYLPGQRGSAWLKFKHSLHQEVVIGGWRDGQGNRSGSIGALLVGVPGEDGLAYAGRVGTGFSVAALDKLQAM